MRRAFAVVAVATTASLGLVAAASTASAAPSPEPNQPGAGEHSTGRNEAGFGGGPHCHVLVVDSAQDRFDFIRVFPSHTGHVHSGVVDGVFVADPDCDGLP